MDGPGRPSLYKPEFAEQAFELCLAGATNRDLADTFEVGHSTIDNWLRKQPEFAQAVRARPRPRRRRGGARPLCRARSATATRPPGSCSMQGEPVVLRQTVHKPPDVRAAIFWLRNRQPAAVGRFEIGPRRASRWTASGAEQARGPAAGQDLAEPDRGLGADGKGDARMVAREAAPDDGGGARRRSSGRAWGRARWRSCG